MPDTDAQRKSPPFRSVLFVPANSPRFIEKAPGSRADVTCLDLEDSVPPDEKAAARESAAAAIEALAGGRAQVWVRVNGLDSGLLDDDLGAVVRPGLDAVMLPKANSAADVEALASALNRVERTAGVSGVGIVPLIETALGVRNCYETCDGPRAIAAAFGSEDFCTDMGVRRTPEVLQFPRAKLAIACVASGITAIDTVETEIRDESYLETVTRDARDLGFSAKLCIHPAQVAMANRVFTPTPEEIAAAARIVAAFEQDGLAKGRAAIALDGKMVDTPHYERAKAIIAKAELYR